MISKNDSFFEYRITTWLPSENVLSFELEGNVKLTSRYVAFSTAMYEHREYNSSFKYFLELNNCKFGVHRNFMILYNRFNLEEVCDDGDDE